MRHFRPSGKSAVVEPLEVRRLLSAVPAGNATPFGYSPTQIQQAYGINSIHFGSVVGNGAGQTIAVVDAFNDPDLVDSTDPAFDTSDLHLFDQFFDLPDPPSFLKVDQTGGTNYPPNDSNWANEEAMDVEWAHALAPDANILLVEANNATLSNLISAGVNYARGVAGVSVISMSFDSSEQSIETSFDSTFATPANHAGVTFVAASGDSGTPGGYPAMSPNVVAVGATTLTLSSSGGYGSETGYSDSGGGFSSFESKPAYQDALAPAGFFRSSPDVSFNGNLNTGVDVYDSFNGGSATPWYKVGGTSVSAPAWSALFSIVDQGRALRGLQSLDGPTQTLPLLYQLNSNDFNDITSGSNGFSAGPGYDLVTGRGTPKANILVPDLAGYASISGTVFADANGNGVQDSGEPGIVGVTVYSDANNNGILDAGESSATTNSTGQYTLSGLTGGTYVVRQILPSGEKQVFPTNGSGNDITVAATAAVTNVNFGDQQIPVTGSITGAVFTDANDNGIQNSGDLGIAGVTVYSDANNNGKLDPGEISTTTNASGIYNLAGLTAGAYLIRQILPSGDTQDFPTKGFGNHVTLSAGEVVTNINFGDQGSSAPPPPGGSITGTVFSDANGNGKQDSGELGIASVTVYNDANNNGKLDASEISTTTNASGVYTFSGLSAGAYLIRQILPSGDKQTFPTSGFGNHVTLSSGQAATNVNFGDEGSVIMPPPTGGSISGTVFNDANGNGKQDSGELGIANVTVYIDIAGAGVFKTGDPQAVTNSAGVYSFTGLAAGSYVVRQILPSGDKQTLPASGFGNHVTLAANQAVINSNFGDKDPVAVMPASIAGMVFNVGDNNGIGDVVMFIDLSNSGVFQTGDPVANTASTGVYTFSGLAAGTYIVRQIVPSGDVQVSPANNFGEHITVGSGQASTGNNFGDA